MTSVFVDGSITFRIGATDCFLIGKIDNDFDGLGFEKNKYDDDNVKIVDKAIHQRMRYLEN